MPKAAARKVEPTDDDTTPYRDNTGRDPITKRFLPGHLFAAKSPAYTQSAAKISEICDQYIADCVTDERSPTIPGLALALGFSTRTAFHEFINNNKHLVNGDQKRRATILDTIKKVKFYIEDRRVSNLVDGKGSTPGAIFDLKNNFGYVDKVEVMSDTHITVTWEGIDVLDVTPESTKALTQGEQG
jgi:hypothetical protein